MAQILEMRNITKEFPGVKALDEVSLSIARAEVHAIVGENGAGKSTLMKILSGSYGADTYSGEIFLKGERVRFNVPHDAESRGIAMIYQEINTHLDMSIAENLFMGRWPKGPGGRIRWKTMNDRAREYLEMVGLCIDPGQDMRSLNASHQQLVCIAAALSAEPELLVLDEPTSALTENEAKILFGIIADLKSRGITSILISHKLDEVFANSDSITVMRDGKTVGTHRRESFDRRRVINEMVGREFNNFFPKTDVEAGGELLSLSGFTVPHPQNHRKNIVENVSFSVRAGEILGLAGLVGAGRSELVNAVFGIDKKRSGRVTIDARDVDIANPRQAIENGLALVTEDRKADGFVNVLSIQENMTLASLADVSRAGRLLKSKERKLAEGFFRRLAVKAPGLSTPLYTLSGGNQQKVVLSKWLMTAPRILILDEPTRGIDVGAKSEIYTIMSDLAEKGMAIILISSELPELLSMSDRIIVLSGGRVSGTLNGDEADQEKIMHLATRLVGSDEQEACGEDLYE